MPDEVTRSTPGNPPGQRRQNDAPAWWADLERGDLPRDRVPRRARSRPQREARLTVIRHVAAPPRPERTRGDRLRSALITAVMVLLAAAIAWAGIGGGSGRSVLVVGLLFGVPTVLAIVTATLVLRRGG